MPAPHIIRYGKPIFTFKDGKWLNEKGEEVQVITKSLNELMGELC